MMAARKKALTEEQKIGAIQKEADLLEAELLAEQEAMEATFVARYLAHWRVMVKTNRNLDRVMAKATELSSMDTEDISTISEAIWQITELVMGKKDSAEALEKLDGSKLSFLSIFQKVQEISEVKKA